jgi:Uncharacterized conserved protein
VSTSERDNIADHFTIDAKQLTASAISGIRAAFGVGGAVALILGIMLLVWPGKTFAVAAVLLGIYFLIAGIVRLALGVFSRGIGGGMRTLDILLGLLLIIAGIIALRNAAVTGAALLILLVAVIGVGWIIEGVLAIVESGGAASRGWAIMLGALSVLAGIIVLAIPGWSAVWLVLYSGIALIVLGIIGIMRAFTFGRGVLKAAA